MTPIGMPAVVPEAGGLAVDALPVPADVEPVVAPGPDVGPAPPTDVAGGAEVGPELPLLEHAATRRTPVTNATERAARGACRPVRLRLVMGSGPPLVAARPAAYGAA